MRKLISIILVAILICTVLVGCLNNDGINNEESSLYKADEAPEITVKHNDEYIDYHVALNHWDGTLYDRLDSIVYIMDNSDFESIPYLETDTIIDIQFSKKPDSIVMKDTLVNKDGELRYDYKVAVTDVEIKKDKQISYITRPHMATGLSSNTEDFKAGMAIRGIKIICQYGKNECEYAFVYRSDPISTLDEDATKSNDQIAGKQLYMMDTEDAISDYEPSIGEINHSSGVNDFINLNLPNDKYTEVSIVLAYQHDAFMSRDEYTLNGKTVIELKNDPLAKRYDDYIGDFKEEFADTDEYNTRKDNGELDDMYREYLKSISDDNNNTYEIINRYDTYLGAEEAYKNAERLYQNKYAKQIYEDECKRLLKEKLDVSVVGNDSTHYSLKGVLSKDDISNFPVGEYGYTIYLYNSYNDANDEGTD